MPRGGVFDVSFLILSSLAVVFAMVAYAKDPSLPAVGARNGLALLWFIIPRLVPALILAGMIQVVIPQETVGALLRPAVGALRHLHRQRARA